MTKHTLQSTHDDLHAAFLHGPMKKVRLSSLIASARAHDALGLDDVQRQQLDEALQFIEGGIKGTEQEVQNAIEVGQSLIPHIKQL